MRAGVEDDLGGDGRRQRGLVRHRRHQHLVVHGRVPLGVTTDADACEAVVQLMQGPQQRQGVGDGDRIAGPVPAHHEHLVDAGVPAPVHDGPQGPGP